MALSLSSANNALSIVKSGALTADYNSSRGTSWELSGHEADVLGAAVWEADDTLFATCDSAGRSLIWQYRTAVSGSADGEVIEDDDDHLLARGGIRSPCRNVCVLHSGGPAVVDISFLAHQPWLVGAQGNNAVSVWDVTRGECIHTFHRRSEPGLIERRGGRMASARTAGRRRPRAPSEKHERGGGTSSSSSSSPPPPTPWPVLNTVTVLPSGAGGGQTVCYGGDDGYVVLYDMRSERVESSIRLNVPITAMCSAAGSHSRTSRGNAARGDQLYVGDAAGTVRWLDLRALSKSMSLAEIWLGKTVVSDLLVPTTPPSSLATGRHEPAAIAMTSGVPHGSSGSPAASAVWLDMKPFVSSDDQRIRSQLGLFPTLDDDEMAAPSSPAVKHPPFWRGDTSADGLLGFPLPSVSPGAQLVEDRKFDDGAWKRLRSATKRHSSVPGDVEGSNSGAEPTSDRRIVRFITGMPNNTIQLGESTSSHAARPRRTVRLLSTCGKEVILYEEEL